jgi:hypothetical protein
MKHCVYNTSPHWIQFLRGRAIRDNVNFWRKDRRILHLSQGAFFYFKELRTQRVVGRGRFRECRNMSLSDAWATFGEGNADATLDLFVRRAATELEIHGATADSSVNCIALDRMEWLSDPVAIPAGLFPQGIMGAKFFEDDELGAIADVFSAAKEPGEDLPPVVLVENDVTIGGAYDDWLDRTGVQYHFPNQYRSRVQEGRRFVYYRGVRREQGRGPAEYFGCGRIGSVWRDDTIPPTSPKNQWKWFCSIDEYSEFQQSVPARQAEGYLEAIRHARGWQVGVREITEEIYQQIIQLSGLDNDPLTDATPVLEPATLQRVENLLRVQARVATGRGGGAGPTTRRSRYAVQIGKAAERVVFDLIQRDFPDARWLSEEGELPGYDIGYEVDGHTYAVEVKGTTGTSFPSIELTANEWRAAQELRDRFSLYLVAECRGRHPKLQVIQDPAGFPERGEAIVEPVVVRFAMRAAVGV